MMRMMLARFTKQLFLAVVVAGFAGAALAGNRDIDELDKADRDEFNGLVTKASDCGKAGDFDCAEKALAQARKHANGSRDYAALKAAAENLELARQLAIRSDAARKYGSERAAVEARSRESEQEIAENRRSAMAAEERAAALRRQKEREADLAQKQAAASSSSDVARYVQQKGRENAELLSNMDRQTRAAQAQSQAILAAQAAERERARIARRDAEEERRRDVERQRAARTHAQQVAQADARERSTERRVAPQRTNAQSSGPQAPSVTVAQSSQATRRASRSGCISFSTPIPTGEHVCFAQSMLQYACRAFGGKEGLEFVQKLSLRSSLGDGCYHVDHTNLKPPPEQLLSIN